MFAPCGAAPSAGPPAGRSRKTSRFGITPRTDGKGCGRKVQREAEISVPGQTGPLSRRSPMGFPQPAPAGWRLDLLPPRRARRSRPEPGSPDAHPGPTDGRLARKADFRHQGGHRRRRNHGPAGRPGDHPEAPSGGRRGDHTASARGDGLLARAAGIVIAVLRVRKDGSHGHQRVAGAPPPRIGYSCRLRMDPGWRCANGCTDPGGRLSSLSVQRRARPPVPLGVAAARRGAGRRQGCFTVAGRPSLASARRG